MMKIYAYLFSNKELRKCSPMVMLNKSDEIHDCSVDFVEVLS